MFFGSGTYGFISGYVQSKQIPTTLAGQSATGSASSSSYLNPFTYTCCKCRQGIPGTLVKTFDAIGNPWETYCQACAGYMPGLGFGHPPSGSYCCGYVPPSPTPPSPMSGGSNSFYAYPPMYSPSQTYDPPLATPEPEPEKPKSWRDLPPLF